MLVALLQILVVLLLLSLTVYGRLWRLHFGVIPAWARWVCVLAGVIMLVAIGISQRNLRNADALVTPLIEIDAINEPTMPLPHAVIEKEIDRNAWEVWTSVIVTPMVDPQCVLAMDQFVSSSIVARRPVSRTVMVAGESLNLTFERNTPRFSIINPDSKSEEWLKDETLHAKWQGEKRPYTWSFDTTATITHFKPTETTNQEFELRGPSRRSSIWRREIDRIRYRISLREVKCPIASESVPVDAVDYLGNYHLGEITHDPHRQNWLRDDLPRGRDAYRVYKGLLVSLILATACLCQVVTNYRILLFPPLLVLGVGYIAWLERDLIHHAAERARNPDLPRVQQIIATQRVAETFFWRTTSKAELKAIGTPEAAALR